MTTKKYILLYSAFVLIKALTGYLEWGTLALRHSALFYYPFFAMITYTFYNRKFVNFIVFPAIMFLFLVTFRLSHQSRTAIIANYSSMIFLIITLFKIDGCKKKPLVITLIIASLIFYAGIDKASTRTIMGIKNVFVKMKYYNYQVTHLPVSEETRKYLLGYGKAKLYNPQHESEEISKRESKSEKDRLLSLPLGDPEAKALRAEYKKTRGGNENHIFRLLIWQDMFKDLWEHKPIFGFAFGKPFNSRNLMVLNWADSEWKRDGWIGAHNSYLRMIYGGGIVGIWFILTIWTLFYCIADVYIKRRSFVGLILCTAILNYFMQANFLLTFELPYTAIPLWCLFGLALKHSEKIQ